MQLVRLCSSRSENDHRRLYTSTPQRLENVVASHVRQHEIEDHEIWLVRFCARDGGYAVRGNSDLVSGVLETCRDAEREIIVVFHDENHCHSVSPALKVPPFSRLGRPATQPSVFSSASMYACRREAPRVSSRAPSKPPARASFVMNFCAAG